MLNQLHITRLLRTSGLCLSAATALTLAACGGTSSDTSSSSMSSSSQSSSQNSSSSVSSSVSSMSSSISSSSSSSSSQSSSSSSSNEDFVVLYAVNAGGNQYTAQDGTVFQSDNAAALFNGGDPGNTSDAIAETEDDTLYQSERYGMFSYHFPVAAGNYDLTLHLIEAWHGPQQPGNRVFDVEVEGSVLLNDYNPLAAAGHDVADVISFNNISVSDGSLDLYFNPSLENANVAAIVVRGEAQSSSSSSSSSVSSSSTSSSSSSSSSTPNTGGEGCGGNTVFCEDFNNISALPAGLNWDGGSCFGSNQSSYDFSGGKVTVNSIDRNCRGFLQLDALAGLDSAYVRYKVSMSKAEADSWFMLLDNDPGADTNDISIRLRMTQANKLFSWNSGSYKDTVSPNVYDPAQAPYSFTMSAGQEACIELFYDNNNELIKLWVDGTEMPGFELDNDKSTGYDFRWLDQGYDNNFNVNIDRVSLGMQLHSGASGSATFDDIVVSTSPVGCN